MSLAPIDSAEIIDELARCDPREWLVATDADGTLWSGDVGEDVWASLTEHELLSEESAPASSALAEAAGLSTAGDATELSARLRGAYTRGALADLAAFEAAALALSGRELEDLTPLVDEALLAAGIRARPHRAMREIVDAARARGVDVVVVTASARLVVERALALTGLCVTAVLGVELSQQGTHLSPRLKGALPYRADKARLLREHAPAASVRFAFGDSPYDADLLRLARTPVAVKPRPALVSAGIAGLRELTL